MNKAWEDYLKIIYNLTVENDKEVAKINDITTYLHLSVQSVNEMVKKLEKNNYLKFYPYKGVSLTDKGLKVAIKLVRSHRIWEVFLRDKLNFSWDEVHKHAELLEHDSLDELNKRLYDFLGKPNYCSHGSPIPDFNSNIPKRCNTKLSEFNVNDVIIIKRVIDNKDLLNYLDNLNIKINDEFTIINKDNFTNNITIKNDLSTHIIIEKISNMIFCDKLKNNII